MSGKSIETIVFDLGGVLVDWDPKYLYNKVFDGDQKKVNWFLSEVCSNDWNVEQDAGRSFEEATHLLIREYPDHEAQIKAFYDRWEEMLGGEIPGTVSLLEKLKKENRQRLFALTNWSAETFPIALERFDFLQLFEGIVVSGAEKTRKPFKQIYDILLTRYDIDPGQSLFIDDNQENVEAAVKIGMCGIHFQSPDQLKIELQKLGALDD